MDSETSSFFIKKKKRISPGFGIFWKFFVELCEKTEIHGLNFIMNHKLHTIERIGWFCLFAVACYGAWSISATQYDRFIDNPTVISLERDYRDWNGTLPAISVCYNKRFDASRAQYLIKRMWFIDETDDEYEYFEEFVKTVVNVNESFMKFEKFANDNRFEGISMLTIAKEVHPAINSVISSFDSNAEFILHEIITERGICYSVNSILSPLISTV